MAFVEFKNVGKRYRMGEVTIEALHDVSFTVEKGEICVIVGASGAGKTTLLNILGGMDCLTSGSVHLGGKKISNYSPKKLTLYRRRDIGFVFQFHQLLPEFTALENVAMPALLGGTKQSEAYKRAGELLQYMGLSERINHKPAQLSGGESQRVAVARALINNPSVILADEPSGSLDSQNKRELHDLFFRLRSEMNQTFVIVTHDEQLAQQADRVLHMRDGAIENFTKNSVI